MKRLGAPAAGTASALKKRQGHVQTNLTLTGRTRYFYPLPHPSSDSHVPRGQGSSELAAWLGLKSRGFLERNEPALSASGLG